MEASLPGPRCTQEGWGGQYTRTWMYTGRVGRPVYQDLDVHRQGVGRPVYQNLYVQSQAGKTSFFLCLSNIVTGLIVCGKVMSSVVSDCHVCLSSCLFTEWGVPCHSSHGLPAPPPPIGIFSPSLTLGAFQIDSPEDLRLKSLPVIKLVQNFQYKI